MNKPPLRTFRAEHLNPIRLLQARTWLHGFTDEKWDFVINDVIRYRMGVGDGDDGSQA